MCKLGVRGRMYCIRAGMLDVGGCWRRVLMNLRGVTYHRRTGLPAVSTLLKKNLDS